MAITLLLPWLVGDPGRCIPPSLQALDLIDLGPLDLEVAYKSRQARASSATIATLTTDLGPTRLTVLLKHMDYGIWDREEGTQRGPAYYDTALSHYIHTCSSLTHPIETVSSRTGISMNIECSDRDTRLGRFSQTWQSCRHLTM